MGANSYSLENAERLNKAVSAVEEIPNEAKKGIEASVQVAEQSGAGRFIGSAKAMEEKSQALFKTVAEFSDAGRKLQGFYKELDEGLN